VVTSVARPIVSPESRGFEEVKVESSNGAAATNRKTCPRCETRLRISYYEPQCLQCGYVDYTYVPPDSGNVKKNILSTGTQYILRYVGVSPSLAETLAHVRLERLRNRAVYGVNCPFCEKRMEQSSLSGKRREVREERFKCAEGHRVSLTPGRNGHLGWR
jgi:hypothetical protein